jgi:hypothetical protein
VTISAAVVLFFDFYDRFALRCLQRFDYQNFVIVSSVSFGNVASLYAEMAEIIFPCHLFEKHIISKAVVVAGEIKED